MGDEKLNRKKRSLDGRLILIVSFVIIGVSFRYACRNIYKKKIIDSGINKVHTVVGTTENRVQFDTFCIKSLRGRRKGIGSVIYWWYNGKKHR